MSKFCGLVGYAETVETTPGVWDEVITERQYYGDLNRNSFRTQSPDKVNADVVVSNEISMVADPYANANFHNMRYVTFGGVKWAITSVEVMYPRLKLMVGGVYNG